MAMDIRRRIERLEQTQGEGACTCPGWCVPHGGYPRPAIDDETVAEALRVLEAAGVDLDARDMTDDELAMVITGDPNAEDSDLSDEYLKEHIRTKPA